MIDIIKIINNYSINHKYTNSKFILQSKKNSNIKYSPIYYITNTDYEYIINAQTKYTNTFLNISKEMNKIFFSQTFEIYNIPNFIQYLYIKLNNDFVDCYDVDIINLIIYIMYIVFFDINILKIIDYNNKDKENIKICIDGCAKLLRNNYTKKEKDDKNQSFFSYLCCYFS